MILRRRGVGEYPGYYCYDAARPSWLPYWLDSVSESSCKWSPSTIAGNIRACAGNSPTCGNPSVAQQDPTLSGPGVAPAGSPTNMPKCGAFQGYNPDTDDCEFDFSSPAFLVLAAGSVAGVALFISIAGGRH